MKSSRYGCRRNAFAFVRVPTLIWILLVTRSMTLGQRVVEVPRIQVSPRFVPQIHEPAFAWSSEQILLPSHELDLPRELEPPQMSLRLTDELGRLYVPSEPTRIHLRISRNGGTKEQTVTINPSQPVAAFDLPDKTTGPVEISAADSQQPQRFVDFNKQFKLVAPERSSGSLRIRLTIGLGNALLVKEPVTLAAYLIGENQQPVAAPQKLRILFPGLEHNLSPPVINIDRAYSYGTATLTWPTPGHLHLHPVVQPTSVSGTTIQTESQNLEFVPPITRLRIVAAQQYLTSSFTTPSTVITATLLDSDQNPVKSDAVREIILAVDPPRAGRVAQSRLVIEPGHDSATTTYTPIQDGAARIRASSGLPATEPEIIFQYPWWGGPLFLLALAGGVVGSLLKALEQAHLQKKNVSMKDFFQKFVLSGILGALLAFFFGATFLRTDFQRALLESASSPLVAIYWGIFGGYLGPLFIVRSLTPKEEATEVSRAQVT